MLELAPRMKEIEQTLRSVDWEDLDESEPKIGELFSTLKNDKAWMRELIERPINDPALAEKCESYDILDKLVVYHDPVTDVRLRFHIFKKGEFDRPHNHRFSYCSTVLRGEFCHLLFGTDSTFSERTDVAKLKSLHRCYETAGKSYMLHHSMVHSIKATPGSITLVARSPAMKRTFTVSDRYTNEAWTQVGAVDESAADRKLKAMSPEYLRKSAGFIIDSLGL